MEIYDSSSSSNDLIQTEDGIITNKISTIHMIFSKIFSGRFILTVVVSICFLLIVKELMMILKSKMEDIEAAQIILLLTNMTLIVQNVFNSYFSKKRFDDQ